MVKFREYTAVSMRLSAEAVQAAGNITANHGFLSRTTAVAASLALVNMIDQQVKANPGTELVLRRPDGSMEKVVYPDLGLK